MNTSLESLIRYKEVFEFNDTTVREHADGIYVKFEDAAKLVEYLQQQIIELKKDLETTTPTNKSRHWDVVPKPSRSLEYGDDLY